MDIFLYSLINLLFALVIPNRLIIKIYIINNYNFYYSSNNITDTFTPKFIKANISYLLILIGAIGIAIIYKGIKFRKLYLLINSSFILI